MTKFQKSIAGSVLIVLFILIGIHYRMISNVDADSVSAIVSPIKHDKPIYFTFDMDMTKSMYARYEKDKTKKYYDPNLITYLEDNNIGATFYVSGLFVKAYPDLIKEMAKNDKFSFQNHGYDESSFVPNCYWLQTLTSDKEKIDQINDTQKIVAETTGQTPVYFRYPGICHDQKNDKLVEGTGMKIDNGTIIPSDPFNHDVKKMSKIILDQAKDEAVVIMHAGGKNAPKSLEVLKEVIPKLQSKGYDFIKM